MKVGVGLGLALWLVIPVQAQSVVSIDTNLPEAIVYADSIRLGVAAQQRFLVPQGAKEVRLVPPVRGAWSITPLTHVIEGDSADSMRVRLFFPYHYQVETIPYGANVYQLTLDGRRLLGETPYVYHTDSPLVDKLLIERRGYETIELEPGQEVWNRYMLSMKPLTVATSDAAVEVDWLPPQKSRRWIDAVALGTAVAAGVLTVHYKFKADRRFDEHQVNGDPSLKSDIRRYDLYSGVALGAMQVGVGVFTIRLIRRR